jgi:hypothetical protein
VNSGSFIDRLIERTVGAPSKGSITRALTPDMLPGRMSLQHPQKFIESPGQKPSSQVPIKEDAEKSVSINVQSMYTTGESDPQHDVNPEEHLIPADIIPADKMLPNNEDELTVPSEEKERNEHSDIQPKAEKYAKKNPDDTDLEPAKKSNFIQNPNVEAEHHTNTLSSPMDTSKLPISGVQRRKTQDDIAMNKDIAITFTKVSTTVGVNSKTNTRPKPRSTPEVNKANLNAKSKVLDTTQVSLPDSNKEAEIEEPSNTKNVSYSVKSTELNKRSDLTQNSDAKVHTDTLSSPTFYDSHSSPATQSKDPASNSEKANSTISYQKSTIQKANNVSGPQERYYVPTQKTKETSPTRYSEPTVTIKIARIEIRALMSNTSREYKREKKRSPPALSLNDYLKKRRLGEL